MILLGSNAPHDSGLKVESESHRAGNYHELFQNHEIENSLTEGAGQAKGPGLGCWNTKFQNRIQ